MASFELKNWVDIDKYIEVTATRLCMKFTDQSPSTKDIECAEQMDDKRVEVPPITNKS